MSDINVTPLVESCGSSLFLFLSFLSPFFPPTKKQEDVTIDVDKFLLPHFPPLFFSLSSSFFSSE